MTPKKDEYMRGYGDGFKDGMSAMLVALKAIRAHRPDHADSAWDAVDEAISKAETAS